MDKTKKKKKSQIPWLQMLMGALIGGGFAVMIFMITDSLLWFGAGFCSLLASFYLHTILHEGGHLVAGFASGYGFVSFRIGSVMWIRIRDKIYRKKFSIPGTGGQCLLDPPDMVDGVFPAVLYNLGGGLSNLLFSAIGAALAFGIGTVAAKVILLPFVLVGVYLAVMNLLPLKIAGIANDGYNIKSFQQDQASARAFWIQMKVNKLQSDGNRVKDMPEDYFVLPDTCDMGNPLIDALKMLSFQRKIDEKDFDGARESGEKLMKEPGLLELYKNMLRCELLFLELIGPCRTEVVEGLYTAELKKYLKQVKGNPSSQRLSYAYAVRFAHDEKMAEKAREAFERVIETYPMEGEIQLERELMEVV